jgi:uncharacterized protein (DUF885 family)
MPFNLVLFRRLGMAVESALPVIIALGFVVSLISPALAQTDPAQQDLASVLKALSEQITKADQVVARLRDTAKKGPVEAQLEITKAATFLGQLADRLGDQGDILSQLRAVKNTAQVHRNRVQAIPKGEIGEGDRTAVLNKWNSILQQVDRAQAKVLTMRDKLLGAITELRVRQVGISEELLAGSYEDAVRSLNQWLDELEKLINDLRASITPAGA